ncbi:MAG: phosphohistidine phosphatase SixA [Pseudomonadales bacterium]
MLLLVMRHGAATPLDTNDFDRVLTKAGIESVVRVCESLREKQVNIERVIASPLVRAQQTATLVADRLVQGEPTMTWPEVSPFGECGLVAEMLGADPATTLVVTHQPFAGMLVEYLTGRTVSMGTATVVGIESEILGKNSGEVIWVVRD